MLNQPLPLEDLVAVLDQAHTALATLRGARIFVTGGTGFFGHWLLESLLLANEGMQLGVDVTVLTRDATRFRKQSPWIAEDAAVTLLEDDACTFQFPAGTYTHAIHAATDSGGQQRTQTAEALYESIVEGTRRVVQFAREAGVDRLLYVSSGAVYGRSTAMDATPEEHPLPPLPAGSYEAAKQAAEDLCLKAAPPGVIARCFAYVGPRLPLDQHFAIGNFIGQAMAGNSIEVKGDGMPRRSWMYMSDLAAWLWTLLAQGAPGRAYNVGSDEAYSIGEAARLVAETLRPGLEVRVLGLPQQTSGPNSYVPSVARASTELGLRIAVPLREALVRTARWYR